MDLKDIFYISEKDWYKLQGWATLAYEEDKNEISGLMTAVPQKDGRVLVSDVEILKQENSGTNTELDGDAVSEYMMKYGMKYNNPNMKFVWWHSHHTMGAFWSGTDTNEIEAWKNKSYSLALVINLKEEYLFRVSFWQNNGLPIEQHVDTTLTIERETPKINITKAMKKQYEELCDNKSYNNVTNSWHQYQQNLWNQKTHKHEKNYNLLIEAIESVQDSFVSGTINHKEYKNKVNKINKEAKTRKLPFRMKVFKETAQGLLNILTTKMPNELVDYDNNNLKEELESIMDFGFEWGGKQWI
jgi:proteasome lid subunit RPN8/RPN11